MLFLTGYKNLFMPKDLFGHETKASCFDFVQGVTVNPEVMVRKRTNLTSSMPLWVFRKSTVVPSATTAASSTGYP